MITHKVSSTDFQQFMMTVNMQADDKVTVTHSSGDVTVLDYESAWDTLLLNWRFDNNEQHTTVFPSWIINYNGAKTKLIERVLRYELDHEMANTHRIIQALQEGKVLF